MTKSQKNILKAALVIAFLCPIAFAEGDMGGGGLTDPAPVVTPTPEPKEGDMGGGGRLVPSDDTLYVFFDTVIRLIF